MSPTTVIYEGAVSSGEVGGARVHFSGMARSLDRRFGPQLRVMTPAFSDEPPLHIDLPGGAVRATVRSLRRSLLGHVGYELTKTVRLAGVRLGDLLRRRRTVLVCRISPIGIAPIAMRLTGCRVVVEVNGIPDFEFGARHASPRVIRLARAITTLQLRVATHAVAVTDGIAAECRARTSTPVQRIENGVDGETISLDLVRERPGRRGVIAYSGVFAPWQDLETLIRAVGRLRERRPSIDWRLILIGDGECRADVDARIDELGLRDRVEITGWLDRAAAFERLLDAEIAVVPSLPRHHPDVCGSPLKLFEYLAAGRRVVGSDVDGLVELTDHPVGIYERSNVVSLVDAILASNDSRPPEDLVALRASISWDERRDRMLDFIGLS